MEVTCHADVDSMRQAAAALLPPHFPSGADVTPVAFAVSAGPCEQTACGAQPRRNGEGDLWGYCKVPKSSCAASAGLEQMVPCPSSGCCCGRVGWVHGTLQVTCGDCQGGDQWCDACMRRCSTSTARARSLIGWL